jgi:hypothetical protein
MIASNQALEVFENIINIFSCRIHILKIKLTFVDLYGCNILAYKNIFLLCKLDQYMDSFQHGQQTIKKDVKVYVKKKFKVDFSKHD